VAVHRDIRPANILVDAQYSVAKLSDFGLARSVQTIAGTQTASVGTPPYSAPEMFEGAISDASKLDVYAFAVTTWELLSRQKPFADKGTSVMQIMFAVSRGERPDSLACQIAYPEN